MNVHSLEKTGLNTIESYRSLPLGGKKVTTPYYINARGNRDLRAMVGKGTPEEIVVEAKIWEKLKGINFEELDENLIREFLIERSLGIDCSGFVVHVLDSIYLERTKKHLWKFLKTQAQGIVQKTKFFLRPVENIGANTLTGTINCNIINLFEVMPGDLIRSKWKKQNTHHVHIITRVARNENQRVTELEYAHSTPYYGKYNGVKFGIIKIHDDTKSLHEQEWLEVDENGVNFSFEGYLVNLEDNGLRRIKIQPIESYE